MSEILRECGQHKGRKGSWKRRHSLAQGEILQTVVLICRKEGRRDSASSALYFRMEEGGEQKERCRRKTLEDEEEQSGGESASEPRSVS